MKLNWIERLFVNSPVRMMMQSLEVRWLAKTLPMKAGGNLLEIGCGRGVGARLILEKFKPDRLLMS